MRSNQRSLLENASETHDAIQRTYSLTDETHNRVQDTYSMTSHANIVNYENLALSQQTHAMGTETNQLVRLMADRVLGTTAKIFTI